ncbi:MAG: Inner rane component of protein [Pseudonocardiales bacterium]|nr:Inner rane component of protein [Pseudonocardiales bacterium]
MSLAQRFERRLEGVVGSAFARVFKGQVEPVEIGSALQREASDKHAVMGNGEVLAPNRYRVSLGASDFERLAPWEVQLCNSLAELVQEYLDEQNWATVGDIEVILHRDESLHTGVFGVASRMEPAAPPRQRPYESLSLPVVPGAYPGRYEHPFGSPPASAPPAGLPPVPAMPVPVPPLPAVPALPIPSPSAQVPAAYEPPAVYEPPSPPEEQRAYDHHGAPEDPFDYEEVAPVPNPYAQPDPYAQPAATGQPDPYAQPAANYAAPVDLAPPAVVSPPGVFPVPIAPPAYGQDPYAAPQYAQPQYAEPQYQPPQYPPYEQPQYQQPQYPPQSTEPPPYIQAPRSPQIRGILAIDGAPTHIVLRRGSNVIGRSQDADLQILDQGVSRRHVDVQFDGEFAVAYDLGSTNGTSVNGHQIGSHQLQHGDVVRVGHTRIVYHQENG